MFLIDFNNYNENLTFIAQWDVVSFTVSFETNGGNTIADKSVNYQSQYGELPVPVKAGYIFDGWYLDEELTLPVQANTVVTKTEDHTLYANWSTGSYTLTYYVDGALYAQNTYDFGEEIIALAEPQKEGYTFSGWSDIPSLMPANDVVINGSFTVNSYTVTYMIDGKTYKQVEYDYGETISEVTPESKTGYSFSGWDNVPAVMPAANVTVTGSYIPLEYTVTYYVDGAVYTTQNYYYGDTVTMITVPSRTGSTFSGWDKTITTMPASDVSVYGTFTENEYTVSYYVDGELYTTQSYKYQQDITPADAPEKEGYTFSGWSTVPAKMPARDIVINGTFTAKQITYYFFVDNKLVTNYTIRGTFGTPITAPSVEAPENYAFSGWSPAVPDTIGAENAMFYGTISKVKSFVDYDLNGGTGAVPAKQAYDIGSTINLPSDGIVKSGFVFGGWAESQSAAEGQQTYTVTQNDVTLYAVWNVTPAAIEPAKGTDTVVDTVYKLISGLRERITAAVFESNFVEVTGENADLEIEQGIGFGTGTKAILTQNGSKVATYEIVIYGDVDGDGIADGRDVILVQLLAQGQLTSADVSPAVYEAADCDHDGSVTDSDVDLIVGSGIFTETISQTK